MNIRSNVQGVTVLFIAIMLVSFILYWPHSQMGYVLDDYYVIEQNPAVKSFSFEKVLNAGLFDSAHRSVDSQLNYYRPVLTASFALDKICWGLNPFAQRIVNLIVHFGNCFLVFALFNLLFKKPNRSAIAAILFCILPIQEWSVRYIVGRGDLLMLFFSLLSVICLIHFLDRSRKIWLWVSLLFFVAAVLSKESALLNVGLVFTVVLYHSKEFKRAVVLSGFFGIAAIAYYFARLEFYPIHAGAVFSLDQFFIGMKEALIYMLRYLMPWSAQQIIPSGFSIGLVWVLSCAGLLLVGISRAKESAQDWACVRFGVIWLLRCFSGDESHERTIGAGSFRAFSLLGFGRFCIADGRHD
jgi:hypothetical protein